MKALSLWQPWASLVACGVKRWETRSWSTSYRGLLAIHAAKRLPPVGRNLLSHAGIRDRLEPFDPDHLPRGQVVALVRLLDVVEIPAGDLWTLDREVWRGHPNPALELVVGDYAAGRYAWHLDVLVGPITEAIAARGRQRLWNLDGEALEQLRPAIEAAHTVASIHDGMGALRAGAAQAGVDLTGGPR